jgi:hypothetical protein
MRPSAFHFTKPSFGVSMIASRSVMRRAYSEISVAAAARERLQGLQLARAAQAGLRRAACHCGWYVACGGADATMFGRIDQSISLRDTTAPFEDKVQALNYRTLRTGDGNDAVQITKGDDGLIHVSVNGKEVWSGSEDAFSRLNVYTGDGDDTVLNRANGANIDTGAGNDVVMNAASEARIDTGTGNDFVRSTGDRNVIVTRDGDDDVFTRGYLNYVDTGAGDDHVETTGDHNRVFTGDGDDTIVSEGDKNVLLAGFGDDRLTIDGDKNLVDLGVGADSLTVNGSNNDIRDHEASSLAQLAKHFRG